MSNTDTRTYYVICGDNCMFEGMTKEQILTAITQAVESHTISDVDTGFVTKIVDQNTGNAVKLWTGTEAQFNALETKENDMLYVYSTDFETDITNEIVKIKDGTTTVGKATNAEYASSDHTKGTIEARLTALGFKQGSIYDSNDLNTPVGHIYRQGNYVLINYNITAGSTSTTLYVIPEQDLSYTVFLPKNFSGTFTLYDQGNPSYQNVTQKLTADAENNRLIITSNAQGSGTVNGLKQMYVGNFGYEADTL